MMAIEREIVDNAMEFVTNRYGLSRRDLLGGARTEGIVWPRWIFFYLLRTHTGLSLAEIAAISGGRNHGTVLHGLEEIKWRCQDKRYLLDFEKTVKAFNDAAPKHAKAAFKWQRIK